MVAFFFGSRERRLFGVFEPAAESGRSRRAVLLCSSWGNEYLYAHRAIRQLARRLATAGFDTLRFDYFGAGDSGGETPDADLSGWKHDIISAVKELKEMSGAQRVIVVGLRLGATLAAEVSSQLPDDLERLVLWDPIVCGKQYLRELFEQSGLRGDVDRVQDIRDADSWFELNGYQMSAAFVSELGAIDLPRVLNYEIKTLTVFSSGVPSNCELREVDQIDVEPAWKDPSARGEILPVLVFDRIVTWLR